MKEKKLFLDLKWRSLFNNYGLALVFFIVWLSFFDRHSLVNQYQLTTEIRQLDDQINFYQHHIEHTLDRKKEIDQDKEKFARERYFMHKDDEDIFIFESVKKK